MEYIALDVHKKYSWVTVENERGEVLEEGRLDHQRGAIRKYFEARGGKGQVAVETVGNWYWIIDEIESAGCLPRLVNAFVAKRMMGHLNKTDRLDNRGINRLQRVGTLPEVWIAPTDVRDKRELPRVRMAMVRQRTQLKNRISATLEKWGRSVTGVSDAFGKKGRQIMAERIQELPPETAHATRCVLTQLDSLQGQIEELDKRIQEVFSETKEILFLRTIPGIGPILSVVIAAEIGDIDRFKKAERFANYAGVVPRVQASGGKVYHGHTSNRGNPYLKWAFVEAANAAMLRRAKYPEAHMSRLYERVRERSGHKKAIVAVARHMAEASFWVLRRKEAYKEPKSSRQG